MEIINLMALNEDQRKLCLKLLSDNGQIPALPDTATRSAFAAVIEDMPAAFGSIGPTEDEKTLCLEALVWSEGQKAEAAQLLKAMGNVARARYARRLTVGPAVPAAAKDLLEAEGFSCGEKTL